MPLIEHTGEWTTQPGPNARAHPRWLARGLALVMHAGAVVDPIMGLALAPRGYRRTAMGDAWSHVPTSETPLVSNHRLPASADRLTMLAWGVTEAKGSPTYRWPIFGVGGNYGDSAMLSTWSYGGQVCARVYCYPDYSGDLVISAASPLEYGPHVVALRYAKAGALDLLVDGAVATTAAAGAYAANLGAFSSKSISISTGPAVHNLTPSGVALFLDVLTDAELREISRNPWRLFAPEPQIWMASAAGGSAAPTLASISAQSITSGGATPRFTFTR